MAALTRVGGVVSQEQVDTLECERTSRAVDFDGAVLESPASVQHSLAWIGEETSSEVSSAVASQQAQGQRCAIPVTRRKANKVPAVISRLITMVRSGNSIRQAHYTIDSLNR